MFVINTNTMELKVFRPNLKLKQLVNDQQSNIVKAMLLQWNQHCSFVKSMFISTKCISGSEQLLLMSNNLT